MKFFLDLTKKQLVKSAASNVALDRLVLKRRDSLAVEVAFVARGAVATMPAGTTTTVALKTTFADANFLALASGTPATLDLNTVPIESAFSANPASIAALLEIRWSVPGETTRTATLRVEIQNSVILGTEATPATIPDGKANQDEAEAGTDNEKWMTPLRTAQAIAVLAPPPTWDAVQNKPATFPPSSHTHAISEVTGLQTALDSKATTTALTAEETARIAADAALGQRIDSALANLDPAAIDSIAEAVTTISTERTERIAADSALDTKITAETTARTTALATKANSSDLSGTAYKPATYTHEVTANSSDGLTAATQVRFQAWTITFRAARTIDFFLPATITVMGQVLSAPQLGDLYSAEILEGGPSFTGQWTARFKRPDGTIIHTVTRADSDLEKSSLRFVYDGSAWNLDSTVYHQHSYTDLLNTPPDVATGYFDRAGDAINRGGNMGQAPYQVVLANDTRLTNARRTAWVTPAPASPTTIASGLEPGAMSYDGSFLYTLVPMPGGQTMRWARTAMSTTW